VFVRPSQVLPTAPGGLPTRPPGGGGAWWLKHGVDRLVALLLLVALAPVLLGIALAVRLTSPGPALFRHQRIGQGGRPFRMWKFRTMTVDADAQLAALLDARGGAGEPLFKVSGDPRITPLGRRLRRWSLDELPQLINVLCGQMSLVGPRPQVAAEVALYTEREWRRLAVRPGITGLWQVSGRSQLAWRQAVELDLNYVEHWSPALDARVLIRTVGAVLSGRGAC
jgi:lipopolysaccharide/colanic/teichoic acid biosynthesis glycosyltransferase